MPNEQLATTADQPALPTDQSAKPKPKLRWYQFSLKTLLLFVSVGGVTIGWIGRTWMIAEKERVAADAIRKLGASTDDWVSLQELFFGNDYAPVDEVNLSGAHDINKALKYLNDLPNLKSLYLGKKQITDEQWVSLRCVSNLETLDLSGTFITDIGLEKIKSMTSLRWLCLDGTMITDKGLEHLEGLKQLTLLSLKQTKITDAGVQKLKKILPNCKICR